MIKLVVMAYSEETHLQFSDMFQTICVHNPDVKSETKTVRYGPALINSDETARPGLRKSEMKTAFLRQYEIEKTRTGLRKSEI